VTHLEDPAEFRRDERLACGAGWLEAEVVHELRHFFVIFLDLSVFFLGFKLYARLILAASRPTWSNSWHGPTAP
jgi:hypothetical protein